MATTAYTRQDSEVYLATSAETEANDITTAHLLQPSQIQDN